MICHTQVNAQIHWHNLCATGLNLTPCKTIHSTEMEMRFDVCFCINKSKISKHRIAFVLYIKCNTVVFSFTLNWCVSSQFKISLTCKKHGIFICFRLCLLKLICQTLTKVRQSRFNDTVYGNCIAERCIYVQTKVFKYRVSSDVN